MSIDSGQRYRLVDETRGTLVAANVHMAHSWWARAKGLLGHRALEPGEGLILPRCRSIHTIGMQFPIDVIFVDQSWKVIALRSALGPWRIVGPVWRGWGVVELASGCLDRAHLRPGNQLGLTPVS